VKPRLTPEKAFTLIEMLAVIAMFAILAVLLLPMLSRAKGTARRTICLNNLRQINLGVRLYCDDSSDITPATGSGPGMTNLPWIAYKELMKQYVGLNGLSSSQDTIFACPADTFHYYGFGLKTNGSGQFNLFESHSHHDQAKYDYSSYTFNGMNLDSDFAGPATGGSRSGIAGRPISSIKNPARTILVAESPAFAPYSWHQPKWPAPGVLFLSNDARDVLSFVDGHVSYSKMYWDSNRVTHFMGMAFPQIACSYDPPDGYDYQWSGD
jgi:prepilin-type N-terminal cleavage/methylation domain-containing protein